MTIENVIRMFAGTVILVSLAFGVAQSPLFASSHWLWLTAFVGANSVAEFRHRTLPAGDHPAQARHEERWRGLRDLT